MTDEYGVAYSDDGKILIGVENSKAFQCRDYVVREGVEVLKDAAFYGVECLESIVLPDSLKTVEDNVFIKCKNLKEVNFPDGIVEMGGSMFESCTSLKRVKLPKSMKRIDIAFFNCCEALEDVVMPSDLEVIVDISFAWTKSLGHLDIPSTVKWISIDAFEGSAFELEAKKIRWRTEYCVRVRNNKRMVDEKKFEELVPYTGRRYGMLVGVKNGKKTLIDADNWEIYISEVDEIEDVLDYDCCTAYRNDGKWGLWYDGIDTGTIFDEVYIYSEQYAKGRIGDEWFWVDNKGKPTLDENKAFLGSWYDEFK